MDYRSPKRTRGRPAGSYGRDDATYILRMAAAMADRPERSFRRICGSVFSSDPDAVGTLNAFVSRMHYRRNDIEAARSRMVAACVWLVAMPTEADTMRVVELALEKVLAGKAGVPRLGGR